MQVSSGSSGQAPAQGGGAHGWPSGSLPDPTEESTPFLLWVMPLSQGASPWGTVLGTRGDLLRLSSDCITSS